MRTKIYDYLMSLNKILERDAVAFIIYLGLLDRLSFIFNQKIEINLISDRKVCVALFMFGTGFATVSLGAVNLKAVSKLETFRLKFGLSRKTT